MLRHYVGHYYVFWGTVASVLCLLLLGILRELRRIRRIIGS